jgi:predicted nuclease with TOPRIM domain
MPTFDQSDKEKLNALIQEARELREESRRLQAKAEALRNFIEQNEQNKPKQADRPKNKK